MCVYILLFVSVYSCWPTRFYGINDNNIISFGGAGYLFDNVSYDLTKNLFIGLLFAIISIGLIFFFLNNYSIPYFIIAIIPNIIPIVVCLGILFCFDFYFSLMDSFVRYIFTPYYQIRCIKN